MGKNKRKQKENGLKINIRGLFLLLMVVIISMLYLSSAILLLIGMLPTFVAYITDKRPGKNKTFTIGSLNFSGCFYYLIKIWSTLHPMEVAIDYLQDPVTIIIIYAAAGLGYIINYISTIIVSSILKQKSLIRIKTLESKKKSLEARWGAKVNGDRPLDDKGFLIDDSENLMQSE